MPRPPVSVSLRAKSCLILIQGRQLPFLVRPQRPGRRPLQRQLQRRTVELPREYCRSQWDILPLPWVHDSERVSILFLPWLRLCGCILLIDSRPCPLTGVGPQLTRRRTHRHLSWNTRQHGLSRQPDGTVYGICPLRLEAHRAFMGRRREEDNFIFRCPSLGAISDVGRVNKSL